MKQNKYDDGEFFAAYEKMPRSIYGLESAGEWHVLKEVIPALANKSFLDLGCGFGWHCRYAKKQQASSIVGVDISEKMLKVAREKTDDSLITYQHSAIEDVHFKKCQFDVVFSSLALHYIQSFEEICQKVYRWLKEGGVFVFSVEHPIFTADGSQNWHTDEQGNRLHWPVDHYQEDGIRQTTFLTENVIKYHRTLSAYLNGLIDAGFAIKVVKEPKVSEASLKSNPEMKDENRRPMFLIISASK
ncbi:bifunctional 2-polyprenyl-6-hydroxyphenol methylase/3-demethylubiquinol 3-O-methyltransferase UbiG [Niallia sp. NCCP-28]|uniref:class I SAM-dependent methyltransferase n=1 Tax=Niallia sp. NCCP-28 TaxID=2934712 RepID=UPI002084AE09|nr:class I SAM-dependent methyltransferase [Niallia sp. NCCP-28]GKU85301.1 SAM-dependent methyltransferase [Niallia sp. NCCP-28]